MLERFDEVARKSALDARFACEGQSAQHERRQGTRQVREPGLEVEPAREMLEPARGKTHVLALFAADELLDARSGFVAGSAEGAREARGVVEIRALEAQPEQRDEL